MFKKVIIHIKTWTKIALTVTIGLIIIGLALYILYKPTYSVTLRGDFIGYTDDKRSLQEKINQYTKTGDSKNIAFVEIENLPEYRLCFLKKNIEVNTDEIFAKVIESGVMYYKYYAILLGGEERYYVDTFEEAEKVIADLKAKDSNNINTISYTLKYNTELKEFSSTDTVVAGLYVAKPVAKANRYSSGGGGNVNTSANVSYSYTPLAVTFIRPISGGMISSRFGARSSIRRSVHTGLDLAASSGTPVRAAAGGTVSCANWKGSYGKLVVIDHGGGVQTYYAHLSAINVYVGQSVSQGQHIGNVGSTGNSTGPHLHIEVRQNGVALNPEKYIP